MIHDRSEELHHSSAKVCRFIFPRPCRTQNVFGEICKACMASKMEGDVCLPQLSPINPTCTCEENEFDACVAEGEKANTDTHLSGEFHHWRFHL